MYHSHVPMIKQHAFKDPDGLSDVVVFVLATIQQSISQVPRIVGDVRTKGDKSRFLFGSKRDGYRQLQANKVTLFNQLNQCQDAPEAIKLFTQVKGLGMVKAAFCAQLCGFETGCLDSHNLKRFNIPAASVSLPASLLPQTKDKKIDRYVSLTTELGGSEYLWNSWCEYVAGNRANRALVNPFDVSLLHVEAIV